MPSPIRSMTRARRAANSSAGKMSVPLNTGCAAGAAHQAATAPTSMWILIAPRTTTPVELLRPTLSHRGFEPRDNVAHTPPPCPVGCGSTVPAFPRRIGAGCDQPFHDLHCQGFVIRQPPERRDPFRADRARQTRIVSHNRTHSIDAAAETQRPDITAVLAEKPHHRGPIAMRRPADRRAV